MDTTYYTHTLHRGKDVAHDVAFLSSGTVSYLCGSSLYTVIHAFQSAWTFFARVHYAPADSWQSNYTAFIDCGMPGFATAPTDAMIVIGYAPMPGFVIGSHLPKL